ncbi:MAG: OPT/YSL family transporter, partial [Candidatus Limnocylindrales bacterium]
ADVEVPTSWFTRGLLVTTVIIVVLAWALFDIPWWMGLLAVVMSALLSIVAGRATGETSITPIGALGKITQFMYGGLAAGNIQTNLMTASVTAGAAMHSADLLTDLKGGYVLGSKPRHQFLSQFFGICAGAVFCIPAYMILATPERLGSPEFPAPAAKTWQAVAELLAGGTDSKVRGPATATPATVPGIGLGLVPVGTRGGDKLKIAEGPNAGDYTIEAVVDRTLVLDRPLPDPKFETVALDIADRGPATAAGGTRQLPAFSLGTLPEGTRRGDWVRWETGGHDLFWAIKGIVGDRLVLDRPIVDPRASPTPEGPTPLAGPLQVEVRKESLPPYALLAVLIAAVIAVVMTLVETYAPKKVRAWIPSVTGIGLGFVVVGFDSISMFIGAVLAWLFQRYRKNLAEEFTLAGASGIMAGASLAGILIIVLSQVAKVLVTP